MADIKKTQAFETSDGRLFKDENKANAEQRKIDIKRKLNSLVQAECWTNMDKDDVLEFLVDNAEKIETIFK